MLPSIHTCRSAAVTAIVVFGITATSAQLPPESPAPATPGAVALLANVGDSAAVERARAALSHADPTVRAIAARVLGIGRVRGAVSSLRSALEKESDDAAAAELVRALLYFAEPEIVGAVEARLPAAPWGAVQSYLSWLITARPDDGGERLERLFKARPSEDFSSPSELLVRAVSRAGNRDRALRGLLAVAPSSTWRAAIGALGADVAPGEAAVMQQALTSGNDAVRETSVWALVERLSKNEATPAGALDAALPAEISGVADSSVSVGWEQFGRELVARRHRQVRTPDRTNVIRSEGASHRSDARLLLRLKEILPAEREAAMEVLGEKSVGTPPPSAVEPSPESAPPRGQVAMRTAPIPWPALLPDLFKVTGCPVTSTVRLGLFEIAYRSDGRPQAVTTMPTELPPECAPALAALARLTIADPLQRIVDGEKQYVVVLVSSEHQACLGGDRRTPARRASAWWRAESSHPPRHTTSGRGTPRRRRTPGSRVRSSSTHCSPRPGA